MIKSRSERFIVLVGGITDGQYSDSIYIYDTVKKIFIESRIKPPGESQFCALNKSDKQQDVMATFGFIKAMYKEFTNVEPLPLCVQELISKYYCNEIVYLFRRGYDEGFVYWMNLDDILRN